jgi:16S rRNA G966 N2-methylase RsmD
MVEHDRRAADTIRHNAALLDPPGEVVVRAADCLRAIEALARQSERFDLVFLDPPYEGDLYEPVLEALGALVLCEASGLIVAEHFHKRLLPERIGTLERVRSVRIGDHCLAFYGRGGGELREREET